MPRHKEPSLHTQINCHGCGIPITILKSQIHRQKHHFHNRECYIKNAKGSGGKRSKYLFYYRCRHCANYIPHEKAITYISPQSGRKILICPNEGCVYSRLSTGPKACKFKQKFREQKEQLYVSPFLKIG